MKNKLPFKKETSQEKKTCCKRNSFYEKKPRSWVDSEPKNWSSAMLRGWYKCDRTLSLRGVSQAKK